MTHTRLYGAAAIILLVIVGSFMISVPRTRDEGVERTQELVAPMPEVTVKDTYRRGVHTISGSVRAPNACTAVSATATLEGDAENTARILLALSMPQDTGICLQVPTNIPFTVTVTAPEDVPITVTVNGTIASTTQAS